MTLGLKFLLRTNRNFYFWFQKNSIHICIFNCNKCILVRLGKGACIKNVGEVRNYSTNTIMEKNKQVGEGKDMEFSGGIEEVASEFSRD